MTAIEDPESQLSGEAAGPDQPRDDLDDWLSDLRTEAAAAPSGWGGEDARSERSPVRPADRKAVPPVRGETAVSEPSSGGRHRAAD